MEGNTLKITHTLSGLAGLSLLAVIVNVHVPSKPTYEASIIMNSMRIYSILDKKANAYHQPFFSINHSTAIRSFESAVLEEGHEFNRHSEDYSLWSIGEFDAMSGEVIPGVPVSIAEARDFRGEPDSPFAPR